MQKKTIFALLFCLSVSVYSQDLRNQLKYADSLFTAGEYFDAVTEYKRYLFFNNKSENEFFPNYKIGLSYKAGAKLDEAVKYLTLASIKAGSEIEKYDVLTNLARTHILRRTCKQAHKIIDNLMCLPEYSEKKNDLIYWKGFTYIFEDNWEAAYSQFALLEGKNEIMTICRNVADEKISVTFAKVISYILPGSGQFYAGEYLSGFISLAWNVFLGYHTINAAANDRVFDALTVGNLLWLRFYKGNIQNAEKYATRKNLEVANKALNYLQTKYIGKKP